MNKYFFIFFYMTSALFSEELVPREVLAIYYRGPATEGENPENLSSFEMYAEMPLNQIGMNVIPYDLRHGIPDFNRYSNLRGIILWLEDSLDADFSDDLIANIVEQVQKGVKFISLGEIGFPSNQPLKYYSGVQRSNRLLNLIGLTYTGTWATKLYNVEYKVQDVQMINFEKQVEGMNLPFMVVRPVGNSATVYLFAEEKGNNKSRSVLVSTHQNGGYIAPWHGVYEAFDDDTGDEIRSWLLNPFLFFSVALDTDPIPKPDTTTLAGRRIYYSHIDGDGWYNISLIPEYYDKARICAEVIYDKVCVPYPDLPITIGVIGAELDPSWVAKEEGVEIAKKMFELPHIEAGTHTFTHPFFWQFFEHYTPAKEEPLLKRYPNGGWQEKKLEESTKLEKAYKILEKYFFGQEVKQEEIGEQSWEAEAGYVIPRYYANRPFNLNLEIKGAVNILSMVTPEHKKCELYQWSGNCQPFEAALALTREMQVPNINGGDTRFDSKYPSYAWVSPVGRLVGKERQIYASASNENTYTNLWEDEYFGFKNLPQTFENTERPFRIKPMNLYYHTYSGERLSSLGALIRNIEYVRSKKKIPIEASLYGKMAQGFYTAQFFLLGDKKWKIRDRGELQTIRFDKALYLQVHFEESEGVIGQLRLNGSLYVYLDKSVKEPTIALTEATLIDQPPLAAAPYLIESQWRMWDLQRENRRFSFKTQGYGDGEMVWNVPEDGTWQVTYDGKTHTFEAFSQKLHMIVLKNAILEPVKIVVEKL